MSITFITPVEVSPDVADAWTDADLSAHIPASAVGVILQIANPSGNNRACGWRKNGSTDNRIDNLNTNNQIGVCIGCDASQIVEVYQGGTATDIDIYLVGYFESADAHFFDNAIDVSTGTTGSYVDTDISANVQGGHTAIGAMLEVRYTSGNPLVAFRPDGSSDDRYREWSALHGGFMVEVVSNIFEQKISTTALDVFLVGYLKSTANFVFEDPAVDMSIPDGSSDIWIDLSSLPAGALGALIEIIATNSTPVVFGLRTNGSASDIKPRARHGMRIVEADGSGIIEGYVDTTTLDFYRLGYVTTPAGAAISGSSAGTATVSGTLRGKGALAGATAGAATVTGSLRGLGALAGSSAGSASASGTLRARGALAGTVAGVATVTGALRARGQVAGTSAGTATASGTLRGRGTLSGSSSGIATVSGSLQNGTPTGLSGTAAGVAAVTGTLRGIGLLSGSTGGAATVTGTLRGRGQLVGVSIGTASASGTLTPAGHLSGVSAGIASVSGTLHARGRLAGIAAGLATVSGTLTDAGAVTFGATRMFDVTVSRPSTVSFSMRRPGMVGVAVHPE